MKAHIIFAHPELKSFNGQMRNTAIQTLEAFGFAVSVSDLHQMKFKASADQDDFIELYNKDFFDIQTEQAIALQKNTFTNDIKNEHQLLEDADLIIFQFPLWWYSMPALLKGYIDRVFSMGWAYGGGQALQGKKILVSMTTGAPDFAWTPEKRGTIQEIFKHLFIGTFGLCGMEATEPFIVYGAKRKTETEKIETFENYRKHIENIVRKSSTNN
jgi:NAD(P)H dehydrogenase (quinone)